MTKIIGFTSISCSLVHPGYMVMLEDARSQCDYLILGIMVDFSDRPEKGQSILSPYEKYTMFKSCRYVDEIIPLGKEQDLELALSTLHINKRFVGEDYRNKDFTGKNICASRNIEIIYTSRFLHGFSSTSLIERAVENHKTKENLIKSCSHSTDEAIAFVNKVYEDTNMVNNSETDYGC